ncbi:hypothetical protein C8Q75DRAFT_769256 [Abortiporus biennis]|nr:hypothetical protein C8Q75DRAFT_769256 [Abortiporus biennis]
MLQHAARLAGGPFSLSTILQAAAGRAWSKTQPSAHVYRRTYVATQGVVFKQVDQECSRGQSSRISVPQLSEVSHRCSPLGNNSEKLYCESMSRPDRMESPATEPTLEISKQKCRRQNSPVEKVRHERKRTNRSKSVSPIDPECLSALDMMPMDPGQVRSVVDPTITMDDPPWCQELAAHLPTVYYGDYQTYPTPAIPFPLTTEDLYQNLLRLMLPKPTPSIHQLMKYHSLYPTLHSARSCNLLVSLCIRNSAFKQADNLLRRLESIGLDENPKSRALKVRLAIRRKGWVETWMTETKDSGMPLPVWLEFCAMIGRRNPSQRTRDRTHGDDGISRLPDVTVDDNWKFQQLFGHLPSILPHEWRHVSPRQIRAVVHAGLRAQQWDFAQNVTSSYFQRLPSKLSRKLQLQCLEIVHLHLALGRKRGVSKYFIARRTLEELLRVHRELSPTSSTLFTLLGTLRQARSGFLLAGKVVRSFEKKYGPQVIDSRVRRRLASLGLKAGNVKVVETNLDVDNCAAKMREMRVVEKEVQGGSQSRRRVHLTARGHSRLYPARRDGWKWLLLRRRFWRLKEKLGH